MIVNIMRPLFDKGVKPETFSNILLELHAAEFAMKSVRHEYDLKEKKKKELCRNLHFISKASDTNVEPLGSFADKLKNRGLVPTGKYLEHVYKSYHASIRPYLTQEVKKGIWSYSCWMCHTKKRSISINIKESLCFVDW